MQNSKWRPAVMAFADLMEARLAAKDAERGGDSWKGGLFGVAAPVVLAQTIERRARELATLASIASTGPRDGARYVDRVMPDVRKLAPDVANYAMMLLDVMHELPAPTAVEPDREAEFDLVDAGDDMVRFVTLPAYCRNNESIFLRLMMTSADVDEATVAGWNDDQAKEADLWAVSVHCSASDHDDVLVPATPSFVPMLPPGIRPGRHPITGAPE